MGWNDRDSNPAALPPKIQLPPKVRNERQNTVEASFERLMASLGYRTLHKGWPDYLVIRPDGSYMAVECKPRKKHGKGMKMLKQEQITMMDFLQSFGVSCYVSDGVTLEPYKRHVHRSRGYCLFHQ